MLAYRALLCPIVPGAELGLLPLQPRVAGIVLGVLHNSHLAGGCPARIARLQGLKRPLLSVPFFVDILAEFTIKRLLPSCVSILRRVSFGHLLFRASDLQIQILLARPTACQILQPYIRPVRL